MQYQLLMNCHLGRKGQMIDVDENMARQLAVNRVIEYPAKQRGPEITKIQAPTEIKRRGRPPKNASNAAD
jgi:hypothetical protein